jgi:hypothetical protein
MRNLISRPSHFNDETASIYMASIFSLVLGLFFFFSAAYSIFSAGIGSALFELFSFPFVIFLFLYFLVGFSQRKYR